MVQQADNTDTNPVGESGGGKADDEGKSAEVLRIARERRKLIEDSEAQTNNRVNAVNDLEFLSGGDAQWEPKGLAQRKNDSRPVITVNVLPTFLHQVTNDQRQNTPSIKVHPVGDNADQDTAKVRQGMIRHIEYDSNADVAYDTAVNSAAAVGFGYFRIMPEYESAESFNQKLVFKRVRNALSVRLDPLSIAPDGSDLRFAFVEELEDRKEFQRQHPKANASQQGFFETDADAYAGWYSDSTVLVAEYYCFEEEEDELVRLSNGDVGLKSKLLGMDEGVSIVASRKTTRRRLMWRKITGADILEETEIKCKWIPVFPVYGDEIDIQGRVVRAGIIRNAKGPCQSYNVMMSGATEEIASRSKAPYIGAEGFAEGHEDEWNQANVRAWPFLEYKPTTVDGIMAPPPQRQPMTDIPAGMLAMTMHAADNIKRTTGLFDASLGARGTATSGKQELAQQREGDVANYHYMDGLIRTIRHAGRCLNCMIPHYYDTERVVAIMREDETTGHARINERLPIDTKTGAIGKVLNDMTCGEYDVTVTAGPSYTTMRQESAEFFTGAMQATKDPATLAVVTWAAMRSQDAPGAQTATKMLEKLLPPPAQAVLAEENADGKEQEPMVMTPEGPLPASQAGNVIAQLQQSLAQAAEALQKADGAKAEADAARANEAAARQAATVRAQELEPEKQATERKKLDAEIARANAEIAKAEAAKAQAAADLLRAQIEQQVLPERLQIEAASAAEKVATTEITGKKALMDHERMLNEDREMEERIAKALEKARPPLPKGMKIKSPMTKQTYDVALDFPKGMTITPEGSTEGYEVTLH